MKKSNVYAAIGAALTSIGAYWIHSGLGIMVLGIAFYVGSYVEFCKEEEGGDNGSTSG